MSIDADSTSVTITIHGAVDVGAGEYASRKVSHLMGHIRQPILFAEVKLTKEPDPARDRPCVAEAVLVVNGDPVRAHVAAHEMFATIDLLEDRLRRRLDRRADIDSDRRRRAHDQNQNDDDGHRHGELPNQRPSRHDRPIDDRRLVKRKTFAIGEMTADEAADLLDLLGHDFLLFTNLTTGSDAVIFYAEDHGLELVDASDRDDALGEDTVSPIRLGGLAAPRYSVSEATEQLDLGIQPFVFFVNDESGRGNVAYHRYDGHYGLISPA